MFELLSYFRFQTDYFRTIEKTANSISHNVKKQVVQKCAIPLVKGLRKLSSGLCSKTSFIEHLTHKTSKEHAAADNTCCYKLLFKNAFFGFSRNACVFKELLKNILNYL